LRRLDRSPQGSAYSGRSLSRTSAAGTPSISASATPGSAPYRTSAFDQRVCRGSPQLLRSSPFSYRRGVQFAHPRGHRMRCPKCMAENAATRRFCAQCGSPLTSPCPACGFENEPGAKFCGGCGKPVAEAAAPAPPGQSPPSGTDAAERRQLTVMFCDLVGSTLLSARLDPEDFRGIMGSYRRCVAETVEGFGGFVARYMGDGVLIYFGYPQAHEDDAERAIRCGLAVVEQVAQLNLAETLHTRIGIATGLVVVGDPIGAGPAQEQSVVGETPNLSSRLQALP